MENLREIDAEELQKILKAHRKWVESDATEGALADLHRSGLRNVNLVQACLPRADLHEADLQGARLVEANLSRALLSKANLQKANLNSANLEDADLIECNLQGATLYRANLKEADLLQANLKGAYLSEANLNKASLFRSELQEADLQDADLSDAKGLLAGQLAGCNVSGAKLPEPILRFEGLVIVDELSKVAKKLFVSILLACFYALLTIATTMDARLLTNTASSPLPIIQTPIPIVQFYWSAPLILLGLYLYFHLYLQRLWERLASLPAVFPDGKALDEKVNPWLLNGLVRSYFVQLKADMPPLFRLQKIISIFLAWWAVPTTLLLFWGRYLPRHDWTGTALHIILLVTSIVFAIMFFRLAETALKGGKSKVPTFWAVLRDIKTYKCAGLVLLLVAFFCLLSFGAIHGVQSSPLDKDISLADPRHWIPKVLSKVGLQPFADLSEAEVSIRPENWKGDTSLVKGARLRGANLQAASGNSAFLVGADLSRANLSRAWFSGADLSGADLGYASLKRGSFMGTKLRKARLVEADLSHSFLMFAILQDTNLERANLSGADLSYAVLEGANLRWANLENTEGLNEKQLSKACVDATTRLPPGLKRPPNPPACKQWTIIRWQSSGGVYEFSAPHADEMVKEATRDWPKP